MIFRSAGSQDPNLWLWYLSLSNSALKAGEIGQVLILADEAWVGVGKEYEDDERLERVTYGRFDELVDHSAPSPYIAIE